MALEQGELRTQLIMNEFHDPAESQFKGRMTEMSPLGKFPIREDSESSDEDRQAKTSINVVTVEDQTNLQIKNFEQIKQLEKRRSDKSSSKDKPCMLRIAASPGLSKRSVVSNGRRRSSSFSPFKRKAHPKYSRSFAQDYDIDFNQDTMAVK